MTSEPSILFVLNSLEVGGSEIKIIKIANALARSGVRVELAYLNPPETAIGRIDPAVRVTNLDRQGKYSVSSMRRLRDLARRDRQTVVAVNLYPLLYVIPAIKWLKKGNVRVVGLVNTADLVGRQRLLGSIYAPFLRQCDQIVFGCMGQRTRWVNKYRLPHARSDVIYNGVDHEYFSPTYGIAEGTSLRRHFGIPDGAIVIGSIGRLAPEKNFDDLIIAVARLNASGRETYAVIAGQGLERERLEQLAVTEHIQNKVKFMGAQTDVRPALSTMDVFVLPSIAIETFSNAALEAMSMGRAVVLSDMGGAAEMVEHGKSGIVFQAGNIEALTDILATLHDSRELRQSLGRAARETVVGSFGFLNMVDRYRSLMQTS